MMKLGLFGIALLMTVSAAAQAPIVKTASGKVSGVVENGVNVYKGIPYAAPPVGDLRWKQPQPAKSWKGVRACDKFGPASLQGGSAEGSFYWKEFYQGGAPEMSEDCLYLNVWTSSSRKKMPVMVWIHGGAYMNGYGHEIEFGGEAYASKGVILVTLNYRLGMCGFLAHPLLDEENGGHGSGNYGLYDQIAALRWVHDNIAAFGGDPDNVTVFGQSAGAGSVQTLISSPLAKGLINKAIIQSGGGLGGIIAAIPLKDAEAKGKSMWDGAGMTTLEQMRACPASKFDEVLGNYMRQQKTFGGLPYGPCIDGTLLEDSSDNVAKAGNEMDIPYMIGYVSEDIAPQVMKKAAVDWSLLLESQGRRPAYVYCFSRDLPGEDTMQSGGFGDMKGAFHSSELWYVFGTLGRCWRPMEQHDYDLSAKMVEYWTNFAKNGNPDGEGLPQWKPCVNGNEFIMELK